MYGRIEASRGSFNPAEYVERTDEDHRSDDVRLHLSRPDLSRATVAGHHTCLHPCSDTKRSSLTPGFHIPLDRVGDPRLGSGVTSHRQPRQCRRGGAGAQNGKGAPK